MPTFKVEEIEKNQVKVTKVLLENSEDKVDVIIPEEIEGCKVVSLESAIFEPTVEKLKSVEIPPTVEYIGENAFGDVEIDHLYFKDIKQSQCLYIASDACKNIKNKYFVIPPKLRFKANLKFPELMVIFSFNDFQTVEVDAVSYIVISDKNNFNKEHILKTIDSSKKLNFQSLLDRLAALEFQKENIVELEQEKLIYSYLKEFKITNITEDNYSFEESLFFNNGMFLEKI